MPCKSDVEQVLELLELFLPWPTHFLQMCAVMALTTERPACVDPIQLLVEVPGGSGIHYPKAKMWGAPN